jgi:hypothetical protein
MSQTNAIILRIKADRAKEFEQLFKNHQVEGPSVWGGRTILEIGPE